MNLILDQLNEANTGLVISVDEIDPSIPEMVELVTTYQHFVRENRKVALIMAGLPYKVSALLSGKPRLSFVVRRGIIWVLSPITK